MVKTRHSLPRNAPSATPELPNTRSSSTAAEIAPGRSLAETDSREAARLATNAKFEEDDEKEDLGTYHWRGAVYAIEKNTPREWIEQGEAEWAKTVEKRARAKKEREVGIEERKEEVRKRKRSEEVEQEEIQKKKAKKEEENKAAEVERRRRKSESVGKSTAKSTGRRRSEPQKGKSTAHSTAISCSSRRKTTTAAPASRRGQNNSTTSSASSNIEVASWPRRPRPGFKPKDMVAAMAEINSQKRAHPPPTKAENDIPSASSSESDSAGDLPLTKKFAKTTIPAIRRVERGIASSKAASKKKGYHTELLPVKPSKKIAVQSLTTALRALSKTKDRVEVLKKWWDGHVGTEGAFQRLIEIVKKIKEGKVSEEEGRESLRPFADAVSEDMGEEKGVSTLLRDMMAEESAIGDDEVVGKEDNLEDTTMQEAGVEDGFPTPELSDDAILVPNTQLSAVSVQPTPPASNSDDITEEHEQQTQGDEDGHLTPPSSSSEDPLNINNNQKSPQVLISPLTRSLLPATNRGGNPLRWSLDPAKLNNIKSLLKTKELEDVGRAECDIVRHRLKGESTNSRRRRVRREIREVEKVTLREDDGWRIIPNPHPEEEEDDGEMEDLVFEHREEEEEEEEVEAAIEETPEPVAVVVEKSEKVYEGRVGRGSTRRRRSKGKERVR